MDSTIQKHTNGLNMLVQREGIDYFEGLNDWVLSQAHDYICNQSYWSPGIPIDLFSLGLKHSWNFSAFEGPRLVAFSRLVTDYATFAYLGDVFVLPEFRGKGISKNLMEIIFSQSRASQLRRIILATKDAHSLYSKYGFQQLENPENIMQIIRSSEDLYGQ